MAGSPQSLWRLTVDCLIAETPAHGSLLVSAALIADDGTALTVELPKDGTFALKMLQRPDVVRTVSLVVDDTFGPREIVYQIAS